MSNEEANKILNYLAKKCGYYGIMLHYSSNVMKWRPYVYGMTGQCNILYSWSEDGECRYINTTGSSHSYAECLKNMLKETSKGCDIRIDNDSFPFYESDKVFLKRGMTKDILQIEIDLESSSI